MALIDATSLSANALSKLEPHRMNNWTLEVAGLGKDANGNESSLVLGLQSFQLPSETSDLIEIYYLNERRQYAGRTLYDGGSLTLTDWIDQGTAEIIRVWRNKVYDPASGRIGLKRDYSFDAQLNLYAPGSPGTLGSGNPVITRKWKLINMWPVAVSWGPLDMNTSDKIQIDVQMVYDKAMPDPGFKNGTFPTDTINPVTT